MAKKNIVTGGSQATSQMSALAGSTEKVSNATSSMTSKMTSAFSSVKSSLTDLQSSIQNMATSLAGITIGGAVSGLAWKQSAEYNLINEQIERAITNNKKLGISYKELQDFSKEQAEKGEGTRQDTAKELYSVLMAGQKYIKGSSREKIEQADAVTDFFFSQQELMAQEQITSAEQLMQRVTMQTGKMGGRFGIRLQTAMGASESDMTSAKKRVEMILEAGAKVKMTKSDLTPEDRAAGIKSEMEKRPWEQAIVNISALKNAIGDSIAGPMTIVTGLVANFVGFLVKIPGAPLIIGLSAAFLALASVVSLVYSILVPFKAAMLAINAATGIGTALNWLFVGSKQAQTASTLASTTASVMATGAMEGEFLATQMTTYATNMSFGARLRLIGAKVWDTAASWANAAANFLGISSLLGLTGATTVATGAMSGLAVAEGLVLSPILLLVGAGLILAGVFAVILAKAGVLKPLLEGISKIKWGKVFGDLVEGDFSGAWKKLTKGFELPSLGEAFKNLFGGTSIVAVLNKTFGIPLNTMIKWLDFIHNGIKKFTDIMSELWSSIKAGFQWVKDGLGITKQEKKTKMETAAEKLGAKWFDENSSSAKSGASWYTGSGWYKDQKKMPATETTGLESLREKYEKAPKGIFDGIPGMSLLTETLSKLITAIEKWKIPSTQDLNTATNNAISSNSGLFDTSNMSEKERKEETFWDASKREGMVLLSNLGFPTAASGGLITKAGLLIGHENEPIVPAEIARSSNLINTLESIANNPTSSTSISKGDINIYMTYSGGSNGNGIYLDKFAFEREVKNIIGKCTRNYGSY